MSERAAILDFLRGFFVADARLSPDTERYWNDSIGGEQSLPFVVLDGTTVYERHGDRYSWVDPAAVPGAPADWPLRKLRLLDAARQEWRWLRLDRGWRHK